jgi:hypothetical protein
MTLVSEFVRTSTGRRGIAEDVRWFSIRQIAGDLGVSPSTAYQRSDRGAPWFPRTIHLHNGDIRARRDWHEQWLKDLEQ